MHKNISAEILVSWQVYGHHDAWTAGGNIRRGGLQEDQVFVHCPKHLGLLLLTVPMSWSILCMIQPAQQGNGQL